MDKFFCFLFCFLEISRARDFTTSGFCSAASVFRCRSVCAGQAGHVLSGPFVNMVRNAGNAAVMMGVVVIVVIVVVICVESYHICA